MKNNLIYENLYEIKAEMNGKIQTLSNQIRIAKDANMNRYN